MPPANHIWTLVIHHGLLAVIAFWLGVWVCVSGVKVNYTRKLNHFAVFFIPMALAPVLPFEKTPGGLALTAVVFLTTTLLFLKPVRDRVPVCETAFASIDRPEDRPYTLAWILSQYAAAFLVLAANYFALRSLGRPELVTLPLLVTAIGDGLAEPVGVRFGRHTYRVPALNGEGHYTRSWEGSAAVFLCTLLIVAGYAAAGAFTGPQAAAMALVLPPAMTLAEARSPHSWDAPLLYAAGGAVTWAVVRWV